MARSAGCFGIMLLSVPLLAAGITLHDDKPNATGEKVVVFFAGLEGSGHSYLEKIMGKAQIPVIDFPHEEFACGLEWNESGKEFVYQHLLKIPPGIYTFPTIRSYPECGIFPIRHYGRKYKYHPRMDWLKEVADKAGVHLKVIFMYRPMEESLASSCLNRIIENCVPQVDVLKNNAIILGQQLKALPPRDVQCLEYGKVESMVSAVKATFADQLAIEDEIIAGSFHEKRQKEDWAKEYPAWTSLRDAMVPEDSALKMLCKSLKVVNGQETAEVADDAEKAKADEAKLQGERAEPEKTAPVEPAAEAVEAPTAPVAPAAEAVEAPVQKESQEQTKQEQEEVTATAAPESEASKDERRKQILDAISAKEEKQKKDKEKKEEEAAAEKKEEEAAASEETPKEEEVAQKEEPAKKKRLGPIARARARKAAAREAKQRELDAQAEEKRLMREEMEEELKMPIEQRIRVHKKRAEARAKREAERKEAEKARKAGEAGEPAFREEPAITP